MGQLLALHLLFAGLWLGCVLTEALFERAILASGPLNAGLLAQLHKRVDLFVEIPAFAGVLVTGAWMAVSRDSWPALLQVKIAAGLLAVAANVWCVVLVLRREAATRRGNHAAFVRIDHRQHQVGAIVLVAMLTALVLGLARV